MNIPASRILIIHLEALGAVLRATSLLPAIRRRFPGSHITWITQKPAEQLLSHNPLIDRILTTQADDLLAISTLEFDATFVIDKGLKSAGILRLVKTDLVLGFVVESATGAVIPASAAATELWEIGLSNHKKFFENKKPETRLMNEALELGPWQRDEYVLRLTSKELKAVQVRHESWVKPGQTVVGINTGCSGVIPYKKLSIEMHRKLVETLSANPRYRVVLLGGKEDAVANQRIAHGLNCIESPTTNGLRDGILSVAACDVVISGDSLGMHIAIALAKWTVAWFGPTCAHEIDLYDRGRHILTHASCSPCWKRACDRQPMCYDRVSIDEIVRGVEARELNSATEKQWSKSSDLNI